MRKTYYCGRNQEGEVFVRTRRASALRESADKKVFPVMASSYSEAEEKAQSMLDFLGDRTQLTLFGDPK